MNKETFKKNGSSSVLQSNLDINEMPKELMDKKYVQQLLKCKEPEELYQTLKRKNLPLTREDATYIFSEVNRYKKDIKDNKEDFDLSKQELLDSYLENVSGGRKSAAYYISRPTYAVGYVIGAVPMIGWTVYSMVLGFKDQLKGD